MKAKIQIVLLAMVCMIWMLPASAFASSPTIDLSKEGSISITMKYDGNPVPGGEYAIFQVATLKESDGRYIYKKTSNYSFYQKEFTDMSSEELKKPELAKTLSESTQITWAANVVLAGNDGKAVFQKLKPGLYLIEQTKAATDYEKISPFLVTIPNITDGEAIYDVDATSKAETVKKPKPTPPDNPPNDVPQTGQLWWPVPVLAAVGILFIIIGWIRRSKS